MRLNFRPYSSAARCSAMEFNGTQCTNKASYEAFDLDDPKERGQGVFCTRHVKVYNAVGDFNFKQEEGDTVNE